MNTDFYTTLKKIRDTKDEKDNDNAVYHLESELYDIQIILKKYSPETSSSLKKWAEHSYNQITKEKDRIKGYLSSWQKKDLKNLSPYEVGEIDGEIQHFADILSLIDDARADLLEHLVGLYPEEYNNEKCINLVKELLPDSSVIKLKFLGQLENKQNSSNKKMPAFSNKIINDLIDELKTYFIGQETQLKSILNNGKDLDKPLVFYGKGIELGHSFRYLIKGRYITGVNQAQLGEWVRRNFHYYNRGKERAYTKYRISQLINDSQDTDNTLFKISADNKFLSTNKPPKK